MAQMNKEVTEASGSYELRGWKLQKLQMGTLTCSSARVSFLGVTADMEMQLQSI